MIIDGPFQETGVRQCAQTRESHVGGFQRFPCGFNDAPRTPGALFTPFNSGAANSNKRVMETGPSASARLLLGMGLQTHLTHHIHHPEGAPYAREVHWNRRALPSPR